MSQVAADLLKRIYAIRVPISEPFSELSYLEAQSETFNARVVEIDKVLADMEAALEPFAKIGRLIPETWRGDVSLKSQVSRDNRLRPALVDDYRRAAEALAGKGE